MDKVKMAWGRGFACVLTLAGLSACNYDESNSNGLHEEPPISQNPPVGPGDPVPPGPEPANAAPHIVGSPGTEVVVGQAYNFSPGATDADGDDLTFSISSKPDWASFDTTTGRLWGTPAAGDVGSYEEIAIRVSDGQNMRSLPQFAINVVEHGNGSVTLAWQPPTENTDGSPLTGLESYKIHYGRQSGNYTTTITVDNGSLSRYVIENLSPGTYFFALTAVSANGAESDFSGEANKTI